MPEDPSVVVPGRSDRKTGLVPEVVPSPAPEEGDDEDCQEEAGDTVEERRTGTGEEEEKATGDEMLARTPAKDESRLYSTSILKNLAGRGPKED